MKIVLAREEQDFNDLPALAIDDAVALLAPLALVAKTRGGSYDLDDGS